MSGQKRKCILHVGDKTYTDTEIKQFDDSKWEKVKTAYSIRQRYCSDSKYFHMQVPDDYDDAMGYHSQCYKDFTAVPKVEHAEASTSKKRVTRSDVYHPSTSTSGVFEKACIFCCNISKFKNFKRESLGSCEMDKGEQNIKDAAEILKDEAMLVKIGSIDMKAKEIKYHHSCRKAYLARAKRAADNCDKVKSTIRNNHEMAFNMLKSYIDNTLIENEGAELLTSLHARYIDNLGVEESSYSAQSLCEKIMKEYPSALQKHKVSNKLGIIIYNSNLSADTAIRRASFDDNSVKEAAMYLRSVIRKMHQEELPEPLTANILNIGQGTTPEALSTFFRVLYTGSATPSDNDKIERLVQSVCDDVVFAVTRARIKPGKHLTMGLGMKSITGARKVIEILNRFGHSVSYHTVESIETDLATEICEKHCATPDGLQQAPELCTSLAWDNYDENTETLSGKGTLHDTVGICYQNDGGITASEHISALPDNANSVRSENASHQTRLSKRAFHIKESTLDPYRKKPKIKLFQYEVKDIPRPMHLTDIEYKDMFWMMSLAMNPTPMWAGWNSLVTEDPLPKQRLAYMDNISLPPTRLDVVAETLKISQRVASECGDEYVVVHYDLAVAKPAMQIQAEEAPTYDNIFICFGPFHIDLAYFGALGHILDGSGGPHILMEADVLASGSLNGFLLGKHFNRCKRLHPLLATAFQILHFRSFLENAGPLPDSVISKIAEMNKSPSPALMKSIETSDDYLELMVRYKEYTELTLAGQHGSTAKFWMVYVRLVHLFLQFSRACRTNDLDLFVYTLGQMCPVFFAGNRPNYARWMVRYCLNLSNIDKTHPGVRQILENGALSVKRTSKAFSRTPVDMALEQTVNADAASRLTGIAAFSHSEAARRRWMVTRAVRSSIVGYLMSKAGLKSPEDITKELKPYRIQKDNEDLENLLEGIRNTMNPFSQDADENLYCLTSGKKVADDIKDDLLNCYEKGQDWCDDFRNGCFADPTRFEKPIPRRKVKNFASAAIKSKATSTNLKLKEIQGTRDLFGRLLFLSTVEQIDLEKVFKFPLTPVPLSLAHIDGSINKTDKAKLLHKIEGMVDSNVPHHIKVTVVDAMFLLHTLQNLPLTYGGVALVILQKLCAMSERVDFVCDTYVSPSIKDIERERRCSEDITFSITGSEQNRPKDWKQALHSPSFKRSLFRFFASEWKKVSYANTISGHQVYLGLDEDCLHFSEVDGNVVCEAVSSLRCKHEEADTRMVYHMNAIIKDDPSATVSVRSNDTDVFILLLYHVSHIQGSPSVWMDAGLSSNNTRRYINISQLTGKLDSTLLDALPALHAFSGSDYTAAFMNKGKLKPFDLLMKNPEYRECFSRIGRYNVLPLRDISCLEKFVCALYGKAKLSKVNDVRYAMFQQNYAPKHREDPMERIKGINPSSMPPCQAVLLNKIKRSNYVAAIWRNATLPQPCVVSPEGNGWLHINGNYQIKWFEGDQVPQSVCEVLNRERSINLTEDDINVEMLYGETLYGSDESDNEDDGDWM